MVAELAAGTLDVRTVADWLAPRLRSSGSAEADMKEAPVRRASALLLAERIKRATMRTQPKGMFARFTDRARWVCYLAQEEARLLRHDYVGTEHLLLGLLYESEGAGAGALESLGISREDVRGQVEEIAGPGQGSPAGPLPFTPPAKKVLELSLREALALGHHHIGTEHLLLGLLREGDSAAAQVLARLGADHASVREQVVGELSSRCEEGDPQGQLAANVADAAERLTQVRREKEAAFETGDLDAAMALRDQERHLLAIKRQLENQLTAGGETMIAGSDPFIIAENQRLHRELDRLRALLRQHGIEPDGGTARTA
jgi:hypothetical protein